MRPASALRIAVLAGLLALVPSAAARAQTGDLDLERTVSRVGIEGNKTFGDGTLLKLLRTHGRGGFPFFKKRPLRLDYVRFDRLTLEDYYRRHGFLSARLDSVPIRFNPKGDEAEVTFYLTEGPRARVESVRFEGIGPIPESRLRRVLQLHERDPLDIPKQDLSRDAVHNEYAERGYVAAAVRDSLEVEGTKVGIVYRIAPGPPVVLDSVRVEGASKTKPKFVAREVTIKRGELLRRSKLLRSQQRIYDTGFYSDVRFDRGEIDSTGLTSDLIVDVRERKMGWLDLGVGYGTVDQLRLTSQAGQRNLWRDGVRLVATGLLGVRVRRHPTVISLGDSRIDLALTRPWNFGVRVAATAGVYAEHIRPLSSGKGEIPPYRAYGGSGALSYDFSLQTHSRFSYEHRKVVSDTTNIFSTSGESYTINRVVGSLERDTRDNPFDPRRGADLNGSSSYNGGALNGSAQFVKHVGTATLFFPADRATTAAFRLRVGLIDPQAGQRAVPGSSGSAINLIPAEERFFVGGANSIRGYGENELGTREQRDTLGTKIAPLRVGGRAILLVNAELRRRLFGPFGAEAFLDGGNVWERPSEIHVRNLLSFADRAGYNDMRYTVGLGIRFTTPIGPVRLDVAWKLRMARYDQPDPVSGPRRFHFSVGQAF